MEKTYPQDYEILALGHFQQRDKKIPKIPKIKAGTLRVLVRQASLGKGHFRSIFPLHACTTP
jgi:hypothetical protein